MIVKNSFKKLVSAENKLVHLLTAFSKTITLL